MDYPTGERRKVGATKRLSISDIENILYRYNRFLADNYTNVSTSAAATEIRVRRFIREHPIEIDTILNRE